MKKLFNVVKKNIVIADKYLKLYPVLKEYHSGKNDSNRWDEIIKLKITSASHFLYEIEGKNRQYLTGEKTADPLKVLNLIKKDVEKELEKLKKNKDFKEYHDILDSKENLDKINTAEDFIQIFKDDKMYDFRSYNFDPFYKYRAEIANILINAGINDDEYFLRGDVFAPLKEPSKNAKKDLKQLEQDKKEIKKIVDMLVPICKRAKATDSSWTHNFFNNKILNQVKLKMKEK